MNLYPYDHFTEEDIQALSPAMKVGLLATVNPQGLPHVTLISTLMAASAKQVVWGQFTEGLSKQHVCLNPKTGFLIMTLDRRMWRGIAEYAYALRQGKEYDYYNNIPMFRYNAYFGVHTVHYMDLIAQSGPQPLAMNAIILAALKTMLARLWPGSPPAEKKALNPWTRTFFNKLDNLKFLAYVGEDGYPRLLPLIQAQALNEETLIFAVSAYRRELATIPVGSTVAVFAMALSMEDVLVRGVYQGVRRMGGVACGWVGVDWVYNSMPPTPMQIYPPLPLEAVTEF